MRLNWREKIQQIFVRLINRNIISNFETIQYIDFVLFLAAAYFLYLSCSIWLSAKISKAANIIENVLLKQQKDFTVMWIVGRVEYFGLFSKQ